MTFLLIRYNPKVWLHASVAILLFVLASCRSSSVATLQDTARTSIIHDTIRLADHTSRVDSVMIYNYGDTMMIRQHTIERVLRDSIRIVYVNDTLRQHRAQVSKMSKPSTRLFGFVDYIIIMLAVAVIIYLVIRRSRI